MRTQVCIYGEPQGKGRPRFSTVCAQVRKFYSDTPRVVVIITDIPDEK